MVGINEDAGDRLMQRIIFFSGLIRFHRSILAGLPFLATPRGHRQINCRRRHL